MDSSVWIQLTTWYRTNVIAQPFDWIAFITGPGLAAAIAIYLLTQVVPVLNRLVETVTKMQGSVDRLNDSVQYLAIHGDVPRRRMGDDKDV